jgi:tetratricopeptide (TPR) repeat protein
MKMRPNLAFLFLLLIYSFYSSQYVHKNLLQAAVEDYDKAISINSSNAKVFYKCGIALMDMKRYIEAIGDFEKTSHLEPLMEDKAKRKIAYCRIQIRNL